MALTGLHTNWENTSYFNDRNNFLKNKENPSLASGTDLSGLRPYYDGSIAIGYGFDLLVRSNAEINNYLSQLSDALGLTGTQRLSLSRNDTTLLDQARARIRAGTATETYLRDIANQLTLALPNEPAATTLLELKLSKYETALDAVLGGHSQLADSKERIAVISLLYNISDSTSAAIRSAIPKTIAAIQHDNRAEAWYEIRYNSNNGRKQSEATKKGLANRYYRISNLFGLYDSGAMTDNEAKEVMRMYTKHRDTILEYESKYAPPATINTEIGLAKIYLGANLNINGEIIVGAGLPTYAYMEGDGKDGVLLGTAQNDLIFGEAGDDGIIGMDGNDVIVWRSRQ